MPFSGNLPLACYSVHSNGNQLVLLCPEENNKLGFILRQKPGFENLRVGSGEMSRMFCGLCRKFVFGFSGNAFFLLLSAFRSKALEKRFQIVFNVG